MTIKPQLACDFDEEKLKFPLIALPKIDGCRGMHITGSFTGRSLKPYKNKHTTLRFSQRGFAGFDGEVAIKGQETSPSLCRDTTSALNRIEGFPALDWHIFDYITPETIALPYVERYTEAAVRVKLLGHIDVRMVPSRLVYTLEELLNLENLYLDQGYEGVIIRDPGGLHKSGRATINGGSYLRIKRRIDFEGIICGFEEAMENKNEAKTNELGRTERSTHQENMVPKGMIGNIQMKLLADVVYRNQKIFDKGMIVTVGPGEMPHEDRIKHFQQPEGFLGQIGKGKLMPHGTKDKPRQATFVSIRAAEDMSE